MDVSCSRCMYLDCIICIYIYNQYIYIYVHAEDTQILSNALNYKCIYIYLEPKWPLFLKLNPPKQGLFQSKQWSFGFQVFIYTYHLCAWKDWTACPDPNRFDCSQLIPKFYYPVVRSKVSAPLNGAQGSLWVFPKNGKFPKMDGENNGKPY